MRTRSIPATLVGALVLYAQAAITDPGTTTCPGHGGDPLARVHVFEATSQGGGVHLAWETNSELWTQSFAVGRASSPAGPFVQVTDEIPKTGTDSTGSTYGAFDATGTSSSFYVLMETQVGGGQLPATGVVSVDEHALPVDSVWAIAAVGENPNYPNPGQTLQSADALIICPDAWASSLDSLVQHWNGFRHHVTQVATLSQTGTTKESIKAWITGSSAQYVLLVGDASTEVEDNIIPSWLAYDMEHDLNLRTDAPYGDRDGDGLSDIALGRWPVYSSAEAATCARKSIEYDHQTPHQEWRQVWQTFVFDMSTAGGDGNTARDFADDLVANPPALAWVSQLRASEISCQPTACVSERERLAINALNSGVHLAIGFGTTAYYNDFVDFLSSRLDATRLYPNHKYSFFLGVSCWLGGTWVGDGVNPLLRSVAERFLTMNDKGAVAWFGPTLNSYQDENHLIGKEILSRLTYNGSTSLGMVCHDALHAFVAAEPSARVRASSYVFLGDPTLILAWGDIPTEGADGDGIRAYTLSVRPNPGHGTFGLEFALVHRSDVVLSVYDVAGRRVRVLARGPFSSGVYRNKWDGRDDRGRPAAAGIYFAQLRTKERILNKKLVLMR